MAKTPAASPQTEDRVPVKCGLVMPISKTASHTSDHWADVQSLLHRAIKSAGFEPENVWEGDLTDRVSERIVANIFTHEIAVVDASDLNPNVMLELGLRLSSKRPTVVISDNLSSLPFDIRDFRALPYPADLNILGMEKFFSDLARALQAKHEAYRRGEYEPFLGGVIVEVVQPETKEVTYDSAVLERMDEILRRVSRLEQPRSKYVNALSEIAFPDSGEFLFSVPQLAKPDLFRVFEKYNVNFGFVEDEERINLRIRNVPKYPSSLFRDLAELIASHGGTGEVSPSAKRRLRGEDT